MEFARLTRARNIFDLVSQRNPSMPSTELDTHEKALAINLDQTIFGSFAEIGAGQEVARWFLQVGAASGTVAKTVSAYDKEVSDDLYGAGTRYVSMQRLEAMLDREWGQLLMQLQKRLTMPRIIEVSARPVASADGFFFFLGRRSS